MYEFPLMSMYESFNVTSTNISSAIQCKVEIFYSVKIEIFLSTQIYILSYERFINTNLHFTMQIFQAWISSKVAKYFIYTSSKQKYFSCQNLIVCLQ